METHTYKIEDGAMVEVPVYETHSRGKNWMATIEADPSAPGGLAREFVKTGRGRYYYIVDASLVGKAVEIAGDYISGGGNRSHRRWYGVVRSVTDSEITIEQFETPSLAIKAARVGPDTTALEEERASPAGLLADLRGRGVPEKRLLDLIQQDDLRCGACCRVLEVVDSDSETVWLGCPTEGEDHTSYRIDIPPREELPQVHYEIDGYEILEKTVTASGSSGHAPLPKKWIGHRVKVVRID